MNHQKIGFSLFSFCIYVWLIVTLVSTALPIFFHISTDVMRIAQKQRISLELSKTMSVITRILTVIHPKNIIYHDAHRLVWKKQEYNQGFQFDTKNNKFYFVEGIFDINEKIWNKRKKSLLSYRIVPSFSLSKTPFFFIEATLSCKEQTISHVVIPVVRTYTVKKSVV